MEPWLLSHGVSKERVEELGEELSGKSVTSSKTHMVTDVSVIRLKKKAARLGQWDFDKHPAIWKLEAGEDGSKKLVRTKGI